MRKLIPQRWAILCTLFYSPGHALQWGEKTYGVDLPDIVDTPIPAYMVDNTNNQYGVAPDHGTQSGPVLETVTNIVKNTAPIVQGTLTGLEEILDGTLRGLGIAPRQSGYWLPGQDHGEMPFVNNGSYTFYRNIKDYGAVGDGNADDTAAINRAVVDGQRCGLPTNCSSTSTLGALIYFPPGTYKVTSPIIQYYYSQFVGDPNDRARILGDADFSGIALIDTDVYIPGGSGSEWYINQNQFYRQVRNLVFDLTQMPTSNNQSGQTFMPTGIHWQVAQATNIQNCDFVMPLGGGTTAVGIFMENGSGGFMSDVSFYGGNIGFRAGSQQYTARGLTFQSCVTAVSMIWDWGITWQNLQVHATYKAIDTTAFKGDNGQGTGSIVVLDSYFENVPYAILLKLDTVSANILLDNLRTVNCNGIVMNDGSNVILQGSGGEVNIDQWGLGNRYTNFTGGGFTYGDITPKPTRPQSLINANAGYNGSYFTRSKPQYESAGTVINAKSSGITGDGKTDQADSINNLLSSNVGSVIFFPAGVYIVTKTIKVPVNSIIVGEGWSQIMAKGSFFEDESNPQPVVQVGMPGDSGIIEMSDLLFTVQGATAGAILVEWNVHESTQGSAGMWDCHFRVGGATGSDLGYAECPKLAGLNKNCMAASMLMHVTSKSSGYFENVWAWVADHDLDVNVPEATNDTSSTQISVYSGRGILIESQGPTWFYGSASEHSVLYQYQLAGAKETYLGHMQTETPYYQPSPDAEQPFTIGRFADDPEFPDCIAESSCVEAWALRVINSTDTFIYGAGLYSFFTNYDQAACLPTETCQDNLVDISYSQGLWLYNLFTKGAREAVTPQGGIDPVNQIDVQSGFTTEVNVYIPFALTGALIGGQGNFNNDSQTPDDVTILPLPCTTMQAGQTFTMSAACTSGILALPTSGPAASQQNDPKGTPETCNEICDFFRLITGTCCGTGGSISNPIVIPANVTIPYDIPLPPGYTPNVPITIPVPGFSDPNSVFGTLSGTPTATPTSGGAQPTNTDDGNDNDNNHGSNNDNDCTKGACGCYDASTPLETLAAGIGLIASRAIPGGLCHTNTQGIILPTPNHFPDDPICPHPGDCRPCQEGVCGDTDMTEGDEGDDNDNDDCSQDLSTETGRCENGNFPLYDPETNSIECDFSDDEAQEFLSACQMEADEEPDYSDDLIECEDQACPNPAKRDLSGRQMGAPKKPKQCPPTPPAFEPGQVQDGQSGVCDATFECNTDMWPNVCNNAASAIAMNGKSSVLTFQGKGNRNDFTYVTQQWWRTHANTGNTVESSRFTPMRDAGTLPGQPNTGWGLIGCQVEEYPFGNSLAPIAYNDRIQWGNRATLRLIPGDENGSHGTALAKFIHRAGRAPHNFGEQSDPENIGKGLTYCLKVTGDNQPLDYLLGADQSYNRCGQPFGPAYLLVNDITAKEAKDLAKLNIPDSQKRRWDPWFDNTPNQLFEHTVYSKGQNIVTMNLPSQYGKMPSPGMMTYLNRDNNVPAGGGSWSTVAAGNVAVGKADARGKPGGTGANLKWDNYVAYTGTLKRDLEASAKINETVVEKSQTEKISIDRVNRQSENNVTASSPVSGLVNLSGDLNNASLSHYLVSRSDSSMLGFVSRPSIRKRQFSERAISGGSYLDVGVYTEAFGCEAPYHDPCEIQDNFNCFDGGTVYGASGNPVDGSDDQSGDDGDSLGDTDPSDGGCTGGCGSEDGGGGGGGSSPTSSSPSMPSSMPTTSPMPSGTPNGDFGKIVCFGNNDFLGTVIPNDDTGYFGFGFAAGLAGPPIGAICNDESSSDCDNDPLCVSSKTLNNGHNFTYTKQPVCDGHNCHGFEDKYFNGGVGAKPGCQFQIGIDFCNKVMKLLLDSCPGGDEPQYGGAVEDNCGLYYFGAGDKLDHWIFE